MPKILYPVGTEVAFKSKDVPMRFRVVRYIKGNSTPYVLVSVKDSDIIKHANVDELCRFENHRYNSKSKKSSQETASTAESQAPVNTLTASDVRSIIREEFSIRDEQLAEEALRQAEADLECALNNTIASIDAEEEHNSMNETIRQKIRYATKSKQERVLTEEGVLQNGALTEQGRRVVIDFVWDNDVDLQKLVYKAVLKATGRDKKAKKADNDEE